MKTISQFMTQDHRFCDDLFASAEDAAGHGDWAACAERFARFRDAIEHHFAMEESVLFPAFEQATGMTVGPTRVMRSEHAQMRGVLAALAGALASRSADDYLGHSETLLVIMQQHNLKEESVLYPLADRSLFSAAEPLLERMRGLEAV